MSAGSEESTRTWSTAIVPESAKKGEELYPLSEEPNVIVPVASEDAIKFMNEIEGDISAKYCITEELQSTTKEGECVGTFKVSVTPVFRGTDDVYCVHASSTGEIDRVPCGTTVLAYVSKKFVTLEQHHAEFIKIDNHSIDRKTFLQQNSDGSYTVKRTIARGNGPPKELIQSYSADSMSAFISEGANILLQRKFVFETPENLPSMQFVSFDADCNLCNCTYTSLDDIDVEIDGQIVRVSGFERKVWPHSQLRPDVPVVEPPMLAPDFDAEKSAGQLPATWQSFYLASGHLATRLQIGSPISMTIEKLPLKPIEEDLPPKPVIEKKPLNYEDDLQLNSLFNQRKTEYKSSHTTYMNAHPELNSLLADFVQHILLRKPDDIIGTAREFFCSFSLNQEDPKPYSNATEFRKDLSMIREDLRNM